MLVIKISLCLVYPKVGFWGPGLWKMKLQNAIANRVNISEHAILKRGLFEVKMFMRIQAKV